MRDALVSIPGELLISGSDDHTLFPWFLFPPRTTRPEASELVMYKDEGSEALRPYMCVASASLGRHERGVQGREKTNEPSTRYCFQRKEKYPHLDSCR